MGFGVGLALVSGCSFGAPNALPVGEPDAAHDAPVDVAAGCVSFSTLVDTCAIMPPTGGPIRIDTSVNVDTTTLTASGPTLPAASARIEEVHTHDGTAIAALITGPMTIGIAAALRADGDRPFAIIAFGALTLEAGTAIDVAGGGAGARDSCDAGAGTDDNGGASGGGGGGFGAAGAVGGSADSDGGSSPPTPGTAGPVQTPPLALVGGCRGGAGGRGNDAPGDGGAAGGVIYIATSATLVMAATSAIDAGGGGGRGGSASITNQGDAGGGGGGSGGLVWLEAAHVMGGIVVANGGAGGEGSGGNLGGNAGAPGQRSVAAAGPGKGGASTGADGGPGGHVGAPAGGTAQGAKPGGGGGGGGAVGYIRIIDRTGAPSIVTLSPALTPL